MMIIGCDFHPSWQQVSWLDVETGETGEQKLVHASGAAKQFYQQLSAPGMQRKRTLWSQAGQQLLRELPLKPWGMPTGRFTGTADHVGRANRKAGSGGATSGGTKSAVEAADDTTGSGTEHCVGLRAHHRRHRPFPAGQAGGQLSGTDSAGRKFGWKTEAGRHHQTRQSHAALVAVEAAQNAVRYDPQFRREYLHRCHQKPKAVAKVAGAQISRTTLLDATHAKAVSRDRSHREQLGAGPGRSPRRVDRRC